VHHVLDIQPTSRHAGSNHDWAFPRAERKPMSRSGRQPILTQDLTFGDLQSILAFALGAIAMN
jgi:hypothetical protein